MYLGSVTGVEPPKIGPAVVQCKASSAGSSVGMVTALAKTVQVPKNSDTLLVSLSQDPAYKTDVQMGEGWGGERRTFWKNNSSVISTL